MLTLVINTIMVAARRSTNIPILNMEELSGFSAESENPRVEHAHAAGKLLAERAKKQGINTAVFDRGGYKYHGRVKAFAEGAREGGLKF